MDTRIVNILYYAQSGNGRSFGGGLADYGDVEIAEALALAGDTTARETLRRELESRGVGSLDRALAVADQVDAEIASWSVKA